jgi:hypothetical protein
MYADDIQNVIGYLDSNGYKIMTDMTNMTYKGPVAYNKRHFIFMFRYEGK